MKKPRKKNGPAGKRNPGSGRELPRRASHSRQRKYVLRLYVSGSTGKSTQAVENIKRICEEYLKNRYDLQVIDLYQQPQLARGEQIVAVPTLIKRFPLPLRRLIGDMSNQEKVLWGLDLRKRES
jgi:circadian clock protein KaiB